MNNFDVMKRVNIPEYWMLKHVVLSTYDDVVQHYSHLRKEGWQNSFGTAWQLAAFDIKRNLKDPSELRYAYHITTPDKLGDIFEGYIGISKKPHKRFMYHRWAARKNKFPNRRMCQFMQKHYDDAVLIIFACTRNRLTEMMEQMLRNGRNIGWNTRIGG